MRPGRSAKTIFSSTGIHSYLHCPRYPLYDDLSPLVVRRGLSPQRDGHAGAVVRTGGVPLQGPDAVLARRSSVELGLQIARVGLPEEPVTVEDEAGVGVAVGRRRVADLHAVEGAVVGVDEEVLGRVEADVGRVGADLDRARGGVVREGDVGRNRNV